MELDFRTVLVVSKIDLLRPVMNRRSLKSISASIFVQTGKQRESATGARRKDWQMPRIDNFPVPCFLFI